MQDATQVVRVYWQPGCTSCLRTKEFLTRYDIAFESRNVLGDPKAFEELALIGLRQVPIVTKGDKWVNGQVLKDVADLVGIKGVNLTMLPVDEMKRRLFLVLESSERFFRQLPDEALHSLLPNRPRSYTDLVYHIFNNADAFIEEKEGMPLTFDSYNRFPDPQNNDRESVLRYAAHVQKKVGDWFDANGKTYDWKQKADVYYGDQNQHQFLERTTWHSAQHARQLMWVLEGLHVSVDRPLPASTFEGLPMPQKVWDDEKIEA